MSLQGHTRPQILVTGLISLTQEQALFYPKQAEILQCGALKFPVLGTESRHSQPTFLEGNSKGGQLCRLNSRQ